RRTPEPRSMRSRDGQLIGLGLGAGAYKASMAPAVVRLRLGADGTARMAITGHEMGQGMRSAVAAEITNLLGVDPDRIEILMGETAAIQQHLTAGSWGCASAAPAARAAALQLREKLIELV